MKRWKKYAVFIAAAALLAGCGLNGAPFKQPNESSVESDSHAGENPGGTSGEIVDPSNNVPPEEGLVRSLLTNEWIDEQIAQNRPIAVMIPNEIRAVPQYSLSHADVLYEAKVEGNMTRLMAVYQDWQNLKKIGNVRSLRSYFAYWAFEWDAVIVHYGGPFFIYDLIDQEDTETIDGQYQSSAFYRTADREAPHNAYTSGKSLTEGIKSKGYSMERRDLADETHFVFAPANAPNTLSQYGSDAVNAAYIDMTEAYPLTRCYFEYDEEEEVYYRSQYLSGGKDGPHVDAENDEQLSFSNILVQRVKQEDIGEGYLAMQCSDTDMDGWFFTRGKGIHVTWEKTSDYGATRFYDDDHLEVELNTGKTMILIIRDTDDFTYR